MKFGAWGLQGGRQGGLHEGLQDQEGLPRVTSNESSRRISRKGSRVSLRLRVNLVIVFMFRKIRIENTFRLKRIKW